MTAYSLDGASPVFPPDKSHWVAPNVTLVGDVVIGSCVSIWFGTIIRGDNEKITVGKGSNIQDNCMLHTDIGFPLIIGEDCTIGHMAILHGCEISDRALIGMGAKVLNGARIGSNSVIGAGSLVPEGKSIPDNALYIGSPARFVRWLDSEERSGFLDAAVHYQQNIKRYQDGLVQIEIPGSLTSSSATMD